ncbi:hypothetical protein QQF64_018762 [Cirrhinus molitorella]|uniref:Uncharacterized protein n=1 Tax=Cirrhinus molitorella TaxID=172907 RepID=A0ABR3LFY6_9TELE
MMAFIKEESAEIKILETFSIKREETEEQTESSDEHLATEDAPNPKETFTTHKNYCYVCKKPQSKISRHFIKHQKSEKEIAAAFSLPKHSKERKRLLEKLRNRGNYLHNQEAIESKRGQLKIRRRS